MQPLSITGTLLFILISSSSHGMFFAQRFAYFANLRSIKSHRSGVKAEAFSGFATTTRAGGTLGIAKLLKGFDFASIRCDFIDRRFLVSEHTVGERNTQRIEHKNLTLRTPHKKALPQNHLLL